MEDTTTGIVTDENFYGQGLGRVSMGDDKGLRVHFYTKSVRMNYESEQKGYPVWEDRDYVIIHHTDRINTTDRPVQITDKWPNEKRDDLRFPDHWKAFKAGKDQKAIGYPIKECPAFESSEVQRLAEQQVYTLEQLAGIPDGQLSKYGMGMRDLQQRAEAALEYAKDTAIARKQKAEIDALKEEMEALKQGLKVAKKKPGRPKKEENEEIANE
jgi:hypothetical protein